tara:strand:+ start:2463 stop:2840 length:378 start_codon:yes stop_codon:yes gene_type:complete
MTIEAWLVLALFVSMAMNLFFLWFSKEQSRRLSYVSQNLSDLVELISNYRQHLRKVYSLEMFYGDETLKFLMEHTNALVSLLEEEYGEITNITDPLEVVIIENEDEEENEQKQDVFYGGTRTGDS